MTTAHNSIMNWNAELWCYCLTDDWIMIEESEIFIQFIQNEETVFWWNQIRKVDEQDKLFINQNNSHLELIHEDSVIEKLLDEFNNIFLEKKTAILINTTRISHFIWFIDEVQLLFESLYNFLTNKLEILKKYLKEMQQCQ